jgi:glutathione peroxidase
MKLAPMLREAIAVLAAAIPGYTRREVSSGTLKNIGGEVEWNFQKYLVGMDREIIGKYLSKVKPLSDELTGAIEAALGQ